MKPHWNGLISYRALLVIFLTTRILFCFLNGETPSLFINQYEQGGIHFMQGQGVVVPYQDILVPLTLYPPGFSVLIGSLYWIFGVNPAVVLVFQILLGCLAIFLFARTLVHYLGRERATQAAAFTLAVPIFWIPDVSLNTGGAIATSFMLISFYFLHQPHRRTNVILSGFFLAAAVSVRSEFIILVPIFLLILIFQHRELLRVTFFAAGLALILLPMSIRNYRNFGVVSPLPGGLGLGLINIIGKYYPDYEKGFAFGDTNVLKAEGGQYVDLTYPRTYEREKERVERALQFVLNNPGKYIMILVKNTPRAWFGQQLYLVGDSPGFQEHLAGGGTTAGFINLYPTKFADILIGFSVSVALMGFAIFYIIASPKQNLVKMLPLLASAAIFFGFFIILGTLGRYTLPGYLFLAPVSYLGIRLAVDRLSRAKNFQWKRF